MHNAAARREDSVQVSLDSLRDLEQQRIEDERYAREQQQMAEVRRLAAQSRLAEQQRREDERAREEALREERVRVEAERARLMSEERRIEAAREAALEHKRIELELSRTALEASALGLNNRGWWKRRITLLFSAIIAVQGVFMYQWHDRQRADASRIAALTSQVETLQRENRQLSARDGRPVSAPSAPALPADIDTPPSAKLDRRVNTTKEKPARPTRAGPRTTKPDPRHDVNTPIQLDCDPREPLCGAR